MSSSNSVLLQPRTRAKGLSVLGLGFFKKNPAAAAGTIFLVLLVLAAIFAPALAPHDPNQQDLANILAGVSKDHPFGTDQLGRDVFSRIIYASRVALLVSGLAVGIAVVSGVILGLILGYVGGPLDSIGMRLVDAVVSIPAIVLILAVIGVLGTSLINMTIALGVVFSTTFVRLTRGEALAMKHELFVDAARVTGVGRVRILYRHVLPVIAPPLIVQVTLMLGAALLAEAGLSFLGVGVQAPDASWGSMLADAQSVVSIAPWQAVAPGLAILFTVLSVNLVGDALRDGLSRETPTSMLGGRRRSKPVVAVSTGQPDDVSVRQAPLLEVSGLGVAFTLKDGREVQAVRDLSLHVDAGETVALVGESGCGKTATAMTIMGLLGPNGRTTSGSVRLRGKDLVGLSYREMQPVRAHQIRAVFQEPQACQNPAFTIGDQLRHSLRVARGVSDAEANKIAIELIDHVRVPNAAERMRQYPHELSGGIAQRMMIALALTGEPELLIADEPTTALDVTVQREVLALLKDLQAENGMGILLVTHDLGVVAEVCDRAAVMYAGEIVEQGTVTELFTDPQQPYTRGLLAAVPRNQRRVGELATIPGSVPPPGQWPVGCHFASRCGAVTAECLTAPIELTINPSGHSVRCIHPGAQGAVR